MRVRKILLFAAMGAFCVLFAALVGFTGSMLFVSAEEADEEQPPCVHSWDAGAVTTEPSCTVNGIRTYTCTLCGETKEEYIAALGHIYETSVTKEPTCTTTGIMRSICARCLHAFNEVIPATAHNYESVQETSDAETYCPDTKFTCSKCGTYYYESTGTTERTEHDISNAGSSLTVAATKNACEFCSWHRYYLCYSCGSAIYREHIYAAYSCIGITKQRGRSLLRCFTCTDICPYILCPNKCTDTVGANHIRESPSNKAIDARAGNML